MVSHDDAVEDDVEDRLISRQERWPASADATDAASADVALEDETVTSMAAEAPQ
jgi:hypothetical protein